MGNYTYGVCVALATQHLKLCGTPGLHALPSSYLSVTLTRGDCIFSDALIS